MKSVYVIDSVRTPVGKYGGVLSSIRPDDLLAYVIKALIQRNSGIDLNAIEDVIAGDANQAGEDNRNVARMAALLLVWEVILLTDYVLPVYRRSWMLPGRSCAGMQN